MREGGTGMVTARNFAAMLTATVVVFICVGYISERTWGQTSSSTSSSMPFVVPYYPLPSKAELCGEAVPLQSRDIRERFDREFTVVVYNHAQVYLWLKRMERYFPYIEKQLAANKLPDDLKWVAVAESDLLSSAYSPAGAAGPWQFIASTGSRYGLFRSGEIDQRHDFESATASAFRYLQDLHGIFNNWTLAIAAYNCGEGRVRDEIQRQKVSSYYDLKLPLETERYIFRIIAIKEVLSHPEKYGYSLPKGDGYPPLKTEKVLVSLPQALPVVDVAQAAGITYREFKELNPSLISTTVPSGTHTLRVPAGRAKEFNSRLDSIRPEPDINPAPVIIKKPAARGGEITHKVARGETLSGIAARYGVSARDIRAWNKMKGNTVQTGQTLRIIK